MRFQPRDFWLEVPSACQRAMLHISCSIGTLDLPDMYAFSPCMGFGHSCISGNVQFCRQSQFSYINTFHTSFENEREVIKDKDNMIIYACTGSIY